MRSNVIKADLLTSNNFYLNQKEKMPGSLNPPFAFDSLADIYAFNGYHQKCINLKALITAGTGFNLLFDDKDMEAVKEYESINLFIEENDKLSITPFNEMLINFQIDFEIFGNAFLGVYKNSKNKIIRMEHLPCRNYRYTIKDKILCLKEVSDLNESFYPLGYNKNSKPEYIALKNYNPSNYYYGIPDYIGALSSILMDRNAVEFNINKFGNNAIPESIIFIKGAYLNNDAKDKIRQFFKNNVKGIDNAGRSLILEVEDETTSIDIKTFGDGNVDAQFRNLRLDARDEIIAAHGIPRKLLGISEPGGLGSKDETKNQLKIFQECVIEPRQKRLESIFNNNLLKNGFNVDKVQIAFNRLYVEDQAKDAKFYETLLNAGVLDPQEVREELGYS